MDHFNQSLRNIADKINARRRAELVATHQGKDGFIQELARVRASQEFAKGKDGARKIASIPTAHFHFLEDLYESQTGSKKFYQDLTFMRAQCPEFLTVENL